MDRRVPHWLVSEYLALFPYMYNIDRFHVRSIRDSRLFCFTWYGVRIHQQNAALLLMTLTATYYVLMTVYVHGGDQG